MTRWRRAALGGALGVTLGVAGGARGQEEGPVGHVHPPGTPAHEHAPGPARVTMDELHQQGGVLDGWRFTMPPGDPQAGRAVFVKLECYMCHEVAGEAWPGSPPNVPPNAPKDPGTFGPALTGMGGHHAPEYLAESILNPNAVIVTGLGYTGPDGLSIMPDYRDSLTVAELIDLVAFLRGLSGPGGGGRGSTEAGGAAAAGSGGHAHGEDGAKPSGVGPKP